jgi:hypothetical protein
MDDATTDLLARLETLATQLRVVMAQIDEQVARIADPMMVIHTAESGDH